MLQLLLRWLRTKKKTEYWEWGGVVTFKIWSFVYIMRCLCSLPQLHYLDGCWWYPQIILSLLCPETEMCTPTTQREVSGTQDRFDSVHRCAMFSETFLGDCCILLPQSSEPARWHALFDRFIWRTTLCSIRRRRGFSVWSRWLCIVWW